MYDKINSITTFHTFQTRTISTKFSLSENSSMVVIHSSYINSVPAGRGRVTCNVSGRSYESV